MAVAVSKEYQVFATEEELAVYAAELLSDAAAQAVKARGAFTLAVSGGRTPRLLFEKLSGPPFVNQLPWNKMLLFWCDERFVPPEHAESNYRLVRESLLDALPAALPAVYRMETGLPSTADAAAAYETVLRRVFPPAAIEKGWPRFDCILLGMGSDGHTASLFPGDTALAETTRWVTPGRAPDGRQRISLTMPVLSAARLAAFLITGAEKTDTVAAIAHGSAGSLPAANVTAEKTMWLLDSAAAAGLDRHGGRC